MSYQQKYFKYHTGTYGLIDVAHRGIWINIHDEQVAHQIKKVFNSKLTLLVVDLSTFVNYSDSLIDSEVCLNWTVPHTENLILSTHSLNYNNFFTKVQSDYNLTDPLINEPPRLLLSKDCMLELQDQIFLYIILAQICNRYLKSKGVDHSTYLENFIKEHDQIFLTELTISDIEKQLSELCNKYMLVVPNFVSKILLALGKLYE